jgi:hypothetical protein
MFSNKTMKATNSSKSDNNINSENTPTSRLSLLELFFCCHSVHWIATYQDENSSSSTKKDNLKSNKKSVSTALQKSFLSQPSF